MSFSTCGCGQFSEEKLRAEQIQDLVICNLSTERVKQQEPVAVTYKTSKQKTTVETHQGFQLETDDGSHVFLRIATPPLHFFVHLSATPIMTTFSISPLNTRTFLHKKKKKTQTKSKCVLCSSILETYICTCLFCARHLGGQSSSGRHQC